MNKPVWLTMQEYLALPASVKNGGGLFFLIYAWS